MPPEKPCTLILVENLPVPLDRRVWQESCALRDAGYEVIVICPKMRGFTQPEEYLDGIQIYRHWISQEAGAMLSFFGEYLSALWGEFWLAWKAWRKHRFKIIHICNPPDLLFLVALPFKALGVKVIYDVHDLVPEMFEAKFNRRGLLYWVLRCAERLTYATADVVLATNESVKQIAIQRGRKSADKIFVVRTAPKLVSNTWQPNEALKKGRRYLVGYVGVMGNADGVDYLIRAADFLVHKKGRKDVQFLLMGTGPEFEHLIKLQKELKLENYIDLPGRVSNEFLFTALTTMDAGVSCDPKNSYNDHCTMNKVLEYMAFGKAQVMFDLKEGRASAADAALYVNENSPMRLAEALDALLDDPAARQQMGKKGFDRLNKILNWETSAQTLLSAYQSALGIKRPSGKN
ncbi:MAG TPA: glycosyltransferase family 4 protein [Verrucomicrobiae bacterium]